MNIHKRARQLKAAAERIVALSQRNGVSEAAPNSYGLYSDEVEAMIRETGCTRDTAKRHIGRALRRKQ